MRSTSKFYKQLIAAQTGSTKTYIFRDAEESWTSLRISMAVGLVKLTEGKGGVCATPVGGGNRKEG